MLKGLPDSKRNKANFTKKFGAVMCRVGHYLHPGRVEPLEGWLEPGSSFWKKILGRVKSGPIKAPTPGQAYKIAAIQRFSLKNFPISKAYFVFLHDFMGRGPKIEVNMVKAPKLKVLRVKRFCFFGKILQHSLASFGPVPIVPNWAG